MAVILRDLPFSDAATEAAFRNRHVSIRADQIMVCVGLAEDEETAIDPRRPFFPALLETGHSHNFSIREEHLIRWAGIDPRSLSGRGTVEIGEDRVPLFQADVWLCPNARGKRDRPSGAEPYRLVLRRGIAVYPPTMPSAPRLALLGLRALRVAGLHLTIDGRRCMVTLRTARRSWFF